VLNSQRVVLDLPSMNTVSHAKRPVMRWLRWLIGAVVVLALVWVGYWVLAIQALDQAFECSNDTLQQAESIDGNFVATAFERNCGATSPFVRIVSSIRPSADHFDPNNRDEWAFAVEGQPDIRMTWAGPRNLTVKYGAGGGRVARQAVAWYGVSISYVP